VFVGALDRWSEAEEPAPGDRADDGGGGADRSKAREVADPDERGRAYEAMRAHVSAETSAEASPGQRPDAGDQRSYWQEVPRFGDMWAKHERSRSEGPSAAADDSGERAELPEATAEAVGRIREAEPRLSADTRAIEQENEHGGWLAGFERRLKGDDRLSEKIAEVLEVEPTLTAAGALREIPDAIRYTYCFEPDKYTKGYYDIKERYESRGHEMYYSQNYWTDPEYKGINTRWVTPEGQRFEVQFHTPESFHAKHYVTHLAYERIRNLATTSDEEREELKAFQQEVSSWVPVPDGAANIPNYRKEGF
jgi:hypothetical protein